jgi:hypothetical protein
MKLQSRGVELRWVKNRQGRILVDDVRALMDAKTRMVSLSAVQFSNGFRQDLEASANLCNERGVLLNLDAIQWVGVLELDVERHSVGKHEDHMDYELISRHPSQGIFSRPRTRQRRDREATWRAQPHRAPGSSPGQALGDEIGIGGELGGLQPVPLEAEGSPDALHRRC